MGFFIKGTGNISPQRTWNVTSLPGEIIKSSSDRFIAVEPEYTEFIDAKSIRRMSRIIKMGVSSAAIALRDAKINGPDAIITGTGYGCLEDTGTFLSKMIENNEVALNPTPFIQSTHNTIGSQIALLLQCQGYNQTYAHGAFSFESAVMDALIQSEEDETKNILIGGVDEITETSHAIQSRFGMFRNAIHGEGSAFFVGNGQRTGSFACIDSVATFYKPEFESFERELKSLSSRAFDLVLIGSAANDKINDLCRLIFPDSSLAVFKDLSGEFPVASAFAVWLASGILRTQQIPDSILINGAKKRSIKNALIVNQYFGTHYSVISMSHAEQ
jgi:hypothetical protein